MQHRVDSVLLDKVIDFRTYFKLINMKEQSTPNCIMFIKQKVLKHNLLGKLGIYVFGMMMHDVKCVIQNI
jgi:hypothetical protein